MRNIRIKRKIKQLVQKIKPKPKHKTCKGQTEDEITSINMVNSGYIQTNRMLMHKGSTDNYAAVNIYPSSSLDMTPTKSSVNSNTSKGNTK